MPIEVKILFPKEYLFGFTAISGKLPDIEVIAEKGGNK
jgi:hypothetical protein